MKTRILLLLILSIWACDTVKVPAKIQAHFLEMEPDASGFIWTVEGDVYQVDYHLDNRHTTSYYDKRGTWLETETEITVEELAHDVVQTLKTKMGEYSIVDIELVYTRDGDTLYEVDLKKGGKFYDILFDPTGKILRKKI